MGIDRWKKMCTFAVEIPRGGAVVARWAHNPKVVSSSLAPATKISRAGLQHSIPVRFFCLECPQRRHCAILFSPAAGSVELCAIICIVTDKYLILHG